MTRRARRTACTLLVALVAALVVPADGGASAGRATFIVQAVPGGLDDAARAIDAAGGDVTREMPALDLVEAELPIGAAGAVSGSPAVVNVTLDGAIELATSDYDPKTDINSMYSVTSVIGARDSWSRYTGRGVDVALLDTGVTPVAGLDGPGRVIHGPDLSFDSQNPNLRRLDAYGHGTHMAGIIAGRDSSWSGTAGVEDGAFVGVAPGARIVSVKLGDSAGATDVSQVIAGIDWVVQHAHDPGLNIRVLNLSFGTPSLQPYQLDPVAHAAEVAWRSGIVVVVAAGNDGTGTGRLANPAQDPNVLAVGAIDAMGTRDTSDDVVPDFSSRGDGVRNPDLVAPGAHVQGLRVPGSFVDTQFGTGPGSINPRFLRGSGTSQAAAVVSGSVALLLEQRPGMTPDQVKTLLMSTTRPLPAADSQAVGQGLVSIKRALLTPTPAAVPQWAPGTGAGSLDAARGGRRLVLDGVVLDGERDIFGTPFDAAAHSALAEARAAWDGGTWNGQTWAGQTWVGQTWADASWSGQTWAGQTWVGQTWADASWSGQTWVGQTWVGQTWVGQTWVGQTWIGQTWIGSTWLGAGTPASSWR